MGPGLSAWRGCSSHEFLAAVVTGTRPASKDERGAHKGPTVTEVRRKWRKRKRRRRRRSY